MERFDDSELNAVAEVIRSGQLSPFFKSFLGGPNVQAFEEDFARYIGSKHAISVSNGTVSLEIALQAMGVGKGDEVITTPLSFIATGTAILRVGATPVFADIDKHTLNIDPDAVEKVISHKTRAILPVSLNGFPANMPQIIKLAIDYNLQVLEDAAQALGASIGNRRIGAFGDAGSFSFQQSKTITTGEGGMIVTDSDEIADKCRHIRNHGNIYGSLNLSIPCTNSRLTEMQAAFGRMQLLKLDRFNEIQTDNAKYFLTHLKEPFKNVYEFPIAPDYHPTFYLMPAYAEGMDKEKFVEYAKMKGISKGVPGQNVGYYKKLITDCTIFRRSGRGYKTRHSNYPNAEYARDNAITFDTHRWNHTLDNMKEYLQALGVT